MLRLAFRYTLVSLAFPPCSKKGVNLCKVPCVTQDDPSTAKAIVDVGMTTDGEAESLIIYSCLAGLKVLDALLANIVTDLGLWCRIFTCATVMLVL